MGGNGSTFSNRDAIKLRERLRSTEDKTAGAAFKTSLAGLLDEALSDVNSRDHELVAERLAEVKEALKGELEGSFDQFFGGSVAKHTYVDGLSDVDSLVVVNDTVLERKSPRAALAKMESIISDVLGSRAQVTHGRMAVTVDYRDGMQIQLLPAIKTEGDHVRIPSSRHEGWSKVNPVTFQEALTKRNSECGMKLVPTIKLAKAIIGQLPESQRLSGYHVESLAISAFRGYSGEKTTAAMLPALFERGKDLLLSPIRDRSGQSVHVDDYLGDSGSRERQVRSHLFGRIASRMKNATNSGSAMQWRALLGGDE